MNSLKVLGLSFVLCAAISCKDNQEENKTSSEATEAVENKLTKSISQEKIDSVTQLAANQYLSMAGKIEEGEYPKTFYPKKEEFEASNSGWWTSGFYPGTLLYLYEETGKDTLKQEAERILAHLEREAKNTSTHDLGFMMYCSFGNANRIDPKPEYNDILMESAKSLATRYNDTVKAIRSWDSAPWNKAEKGDLVVIIDNMMNLELLFWAADHSGDERYREIAINHANTTMKNHFRDDYSTYHELIYDEQTGEAKSKITAQGFADESSWARGQAWGLYGYTLMYRETKDQKYLDQAKNIAKFILEHPNMPEDMVPYWDFDAEDIPDDLRDSSAAAVIASALLELYKYTDDENYFNAAEKMLSSLMSEEYLAKQDELGGFLLKHGVGSKPANSEVDVPLTYGDYYFVEALKRYEEL
ncbi:glycoside hydrolase family 88 protein [Zunongwangia sp. HRR-M8]|uniref:glycoside hydrolase family 88 protein n=1 Tax=Zunongwangia sp. HRR-M8 TaxID=3015170 RepID=UPI0022DE489E|nr:glycoside hydrolase family 88 protein [Zunongwangia sp. HRR-M8]WBL21562.1 glycoside hydrolase family 88 protein [Zunongwangia sp. HRR-M8]